MDRHDWFLLIFAALLGLAIVAVPLSKAWPHDYYSQACCDENDCHVIEDSRVQVTPEGYLVDGKWFFSFAEAKHAPENKYSICQTVETMKPRCFYAPGRES